MPKFKVVLWDVDGTLLDFKASEKSAIKKCFEIFNFKGCSDETIEVYSKINVRYWAALERGEISKKEALIGRFKEFFGLLGLPVDKASDFNDVYQVRLGDYAVFYSGVEETLEKIKKYGVLQFGVTNGTKIAQERKLKVSGLDKMLDGVFISDEIGYEKPNTEFFKPVLAEVERRIPSIKSNEILIVGDSLTSDIQGGINAGIKTCWFNYGGKRSIDTANCDYVIAEIKKAIELL